MPTTCDIFFDHTDGIYNSGDIINGHIKLYTTNTKSIRGIYIKISGYADVKWEQRTTSENNNRSTEYYSRYYKAHEQYLNSITYVVGQENGLFFDLLPGIYEHAFSCTLPRELPTSCDETYGKIIYETTVVIDRSFMNNDFKRQFKVNHCVDLNWNPDNKLPKIQKDTRGICCLYCCFTSGAEVHVALKIPFGGTLPGQIIPFTLNILNDSNINMKNSKVKLTKVMTFECREPYRQCKDIITDLDTKFFDPVLSLSRKEYKSTLHVPSGTPCTQLGKCIRIEYFVKAKIYMACCINDIEIEIPITIGLIPIVDYNDDTNNVITTQPTLPLSLILPTPPSLISPLQPSSVPPSISELPTPISAPTISAPPPTPPPPLDLTSDINSLPPSYEDAIRMENRNKVEGRKNENKFIQLPINFDGHSSGMSMASSNSNNDSVIAAGSATTSLSNVNRNYGWTDAES